jgi:hypothetical protein
MLYGWRQIATEAFATVVLLGHLTAVCSSENSDSCKLSPHARVNPIKRKIHVSWGNHFYVMNKR